MDLAAVWLGKLTVLALRLAGRRGTALPGLLVEKVFPGYLPRQLSKLADGVVLVTGTNGKTTTTKMIAALLSQQHRVLTNDTGGNFVRGTLTSMVLAASWSGRLTADVAVFELDEAHAVKFCAIHRPRRTLLLNVLRDQLDRFGEIDTTARLLGSVAALTTAEVVLNADDPRLLALAGDLAAKVSYFGVAEPLRSLFPSDDQLYDEPDMLVAQASVPVAAQLLSIETPEAGASMIVHLLLGDTVLDATLHIDGIHNAQNAAAAAAVGVSMGLTSAEIATGLAAVQPAFGRGQSFDVDGRRVVLQLVKNPAGFRLSLRTVSVLKPAAIVIAINDDYPDGRDMSWLWDVDFSTALNGVAGVLMTAGTRASDMALRLHYDELATEPPEIDLQRALEQAVARVQPGETVAVFATYTAMWQLHRSLTESNRRLGLARR